MDIQRSSYIFIAVFVIIMFLAIGSKARAEIYDPKCPGVCSPEIVPNCKTLCGSLGYHAGGYCNGLTCCCKTKIL
ncbi:unnamed protein product [Thlaspi arvense]|uniref:Uncharacterized protein n=1 Tax=Thlaspi arvense TaxID=13288 RepID=A0AAU9RQA2_THLAR|nr:unnamed protein product [Thlaspi arvense]